MINRLYLFVHGLTLFREMGNWIQIILPRVELLPALGVRKPLLRGIFFSDLYSAGA